jgi:hypothetical protein
LELQEQLRIVCMKHTLEFVALDFAC